MRVSLEIIKTATRVLSAVTDQQTPDPADVQALRDFDGRGNGRDLETLACDAVQKAIRRRTEIRHLTGGYFG